MGLLHNSRLRSQPRWVSGEQAGEPDIGQTQPKHDDTLQTNSTAGVRRTSVLESIDVVLETRVLWVDGRDVFAHSLLQELRVVNTLSTRQDFLAAHEEVEGVAVAGVGVRGAVFVRGRVNGWHGVEGADVQRVLVQDVEVGAVLLEDETAEVLLVRCAKSMSVVISNFRPELIVTHLKSSKSLISTPASRSILIPSQKGRRTVLPASGSLKSST